MYAHARKYGLTGTDAMVYEALVFLCKKTGECRVSYSKLAEFSCCGDRSTAYRALRVLLEKGLVLQNATGVLQIATETLQNATIPKEKRTKKENTKINNKSLPANNKPSGGGLAGFDEFWKNFSPVGEYVRRKKACLEYWKDDTKMTDDWRRLAIERASEHEGQPNPYFWLCNEDFLRVGASADTKIEDSPHWLTNEDQYTLMQAGAVLAFCHKPDGKGFGTVTQADAERFNLHKVRDVKLSN